jgi:hypothetical protein
MRRSHDECYKKQVFTSVLQPRGAHGGGIPSGLTLSWLSDWQNGATSLRWRRKGPEKRGERDARADAIAQQHAKVGYRYGQRTFVVEDGKAGGRLRLRAMSNNFQNVSRCLGSVHSPALVRQVRRRQDRQAGDPDHQAAAPLDRALRKRCKAQTGLAWGLGSRLRRLRDALTARPQDARPAPAHPQGPETQAAKPLKTARLTSVSEARNTRLLQCTIGA